MKRSDPQTVVETAQKLPYAYDAKQTDGVIHVVEKSTHSFHYTGWGDLMTGHGWYVSGVTRLESGTRIWQLQPVPSVNEIGEADS